MSDWDLWVDKLIEEETTNIEEALCGLNENEMELIGIPVEKKKRGRPPTKIVEGSQPVTRQMKFLRIARGKLNEAIKRLEKLRGLRASKV